MQIVLLRHGKPKIRTGLRVSAAELEVWIAEYNAADIDPDFPPSDETVEQMKSCSFAVCSDLARSKESAAALGIEHVGACDSMFRELDRLLWALGYSANGESISEGRDRARLCAKRLAKIAAEHGNVVFVGHGSLIWFIARRLRAMGWSGPKKSPSKYWGFAVYSYERT